MGFTARDDAEFSFEQWLSGLISDPELDVEPDEDATQDWLREVHRQNGAVTTPWLHLLIFERRGRLAHDLLATIRRQAEAGLGELTGLSVQASEPTPEFPSGLITVEDTAIRGVDQAEAAIEVADGVQTSIARSRQLMWPRCPIHGNGLHPELCRGAPRWICHQGPHPLRNILDQPSSGSAPREREIDGGCRCRGY